LAEACVAAVGGAYGGLGCGRGFHAVVHDEEERCAWRGTDHRGPNAVVYASEAAGGPKSGGGLEPGFDRVEGKEGGVDGGACYGACLGRFISGRSTYEILLI
jgi:hypothetical protein